MSRSWDRAPKCHTRGPRFAVKVKEGPGRKIERVVFDLLNTSEQLGGSIALAVLANSYGDPYCERPSRTDDERIRRRGAGLRLPCRICECLSSLAGSRTIVALRLRGAAVRASPIRSTCRRGSPGSLGSSWSVY